MRINTALILCAGFGKRLNPITLHIPKPLLKIRDITMLEKCIILIEKLGIKKIILNTFYLKDQFLEFLNTQNFNLDIKIIEDTKYTFKCFFGFGIWCTFACYGSCCLPYLTVRNNQYGTVQSRDFFNVNVALDV